MRSRASSLLSHLILAALATSAPGAEERAHRCAAVPEPAERLACYDAEFPPRLIDTTPLSAAPPSSSAGRNFGFTPEEAQARAPTGTRQPREQAMTVASLQRKPTGEFVVHMENGQVWEQTELNSRARLRPGSAVRIKRGAFGSYLLVTPDGIGTSVRRLD